MTKRTNRPKYVMRRVVSAKRGDHYDGKAHDWCKLECGHIVTPENNGRTFRVNGKTKARCYACAGDARYIYSEA